ncbi:MAG: diguanylate cyclase [bacterium]
MKIIIVEDCEQGRNILRKLLVKRGYEVVVACDGNEALSKICADQSIGIALVDWSMSHMDGVTLVSRIKKLKDRYVHTIMVTARTTIPDECHALDSGADDFIRKPFGLAELSARIRVGERTLARMKEQSDLANKDALTQLANRRKIHSQVETWLQQSASLAVCLIDVDDFKEINGSYGYEMGDEVIKGVAEVLSHFSSESVIVGRWGGDEMILVFRQFTKEAISAMAQEVFRDVKEMSQRLDVFVTISVGVAIGQKGQKSSFDELYSDALAMLRIAKEDKNTICI